MLYQYRDTVCQYYLLYTCITYSLVAIIATVQCNTVLYTLHVATVQPCTYDGMHTVYIL